MIKKSLLCLLLIALSACNEESILLKKALSQAYQEQRCITDSLRQARVKDDPDMRQLIDDLWRNELQKAMSAKQANKPVKDLTIKVALTVIYLNNEDKISDEQIAQQMQILNDAFSGANYTKDFIPHEFKKVAAGDTHIRFVHQMTRQFISDKEKWGAFEPLDPEKGGMAPHLPEKFMNIYVVPANKKNTVAYASTPEMHGFEEFDAVVLNQLSFGINQSPKYNQGKSLVHEVGHYLGLEHTFGLEEFAENKDASDDNFNYRCSSDDISDTPPTPENNGNPTYPLMRTCDGVNRSVMFMNYMDYCNDESMTMFTLEQKMRLRFFAAIGRPGLIKIE